MNTVGPDLSWRLIYSDSAAIQIIHSQGYSFSNFHIFESDTKQGCYDKITDLGITPLPDADPVPPPLIGVLVSNPMVANLNAGNYSISSLTDVTGTGTFTAGHFAGEGSSITAVTAIAAPWSGISSKPVSVVAIGSLTPAANTIGYFTGASTAASTALTAVGRSVIGGADAAAVRTVLALGTAATSSIGDFDSSGSAATVAGNLTTHTSNTSNPHSVTASQVGLGNVNNTSDANKPVSTAQQTAINLKIDLTQKGAANGVAPLDSGSKISTSYLPASVLGAVNYQGTWNASTNTPTLTSGVGTKGFFYKVSVAGTTSIDGQSVWSVGDSIVFDGTTWDGIDGITSEVISVAGRTGAVVLVKGDVGLGSVDNTSDTGKPVSTAQQTALDLKAPLASPGLTGVPTAPTATANTNTTQIATTAFVLGQAYAPLASPALTGTPTSPTASGGTNTTQVATTAFVTSAVSTKAGVAVTNTFALGQAIVGASDMVQLSVKGNGTQASNIVEYKKSDNTVLFSVDNSGNLSFAGSMTGKIILRNTTASSLSSVVLDTGEAGWTTDTKLFYLGDGSTAGGIFIGPITGTNNTWTGSQQFNSVGGFNVAIPAAANGTLISLVAGEGTGSSFGASNGGAFVITAGKTSGTQAVPAGGQLSLNGGACTSAAGFGGSVAISGGGASGSGSTTGGNVTINPGVGNTTGVVKVGNSGGSVEIGRGGGTVTFKNFASAGVVKSTSAGVVSIDTTPYETVVASTTGVNAKTVANTLLYTVPAGKTFIPTRVVVWVTAASSITVGPTIDIATTAGGGGDIYASAVLTTLTTTSQIYTFGVFGMSKAVPAAGTVYADLTNAATGTSQTLTIDLLGYLE